MRIKNTAIIVEIYLTHILVLFKLKYPNDEPTIDVIKFVDEDTIEIPKGKFPITIILADRKLIKISEVLNKIFSIKYVFLFKTLILFKISPAFIVKKSIKTFMAYYFLYKCHI